MKLNNILWNKGEKAQNPTPSYTGNRTAYALPSNPNPVNDKTNATNGKIIIEATIKFRHQCPLLFLFLNKTKKVRIKHNV
jgi:hypothetical protein